MILRLKIWNADDEAMSFLSWKDERFEIIKVFRCLMYLHKHTTIYTHRNIWIWFIHLFNKIIGRNNHHFVASYPRTYTLFEHEIFEHRFYYLKIIEQQLIIKFNLRSTYNILLQYFGWVDNKKTFNPFLFVISHKVETIWFDWIRQDFSAKQENAATNIEKDWWNSSFGLFYQNSRKFDLKNLLTRTFLLKWFGLMEQEFYNLWLIENMLKNYYVNFNFY